MTTVGEIGEFGLIERIAASVSDAGLATPTAGGFSLILGIGDDAAAWRVAEGIEVSTTDTAVEGVHFTRETIPWADLGWKLWAANVSDVVAMGGAPLVGVVTLGLPGDLEVEAIDQLYDGMLEACRCYDTVIVGGDVVSARDFFMTVALNGVCDGEPLRRDAAEPGDAVAVSGPLGGSAGGLRVLVDGLAASDVLVATHRRPQPRVSSGIALRSEGVRCAMDISDGLAADLGKLCMASGVGATIEAPRVPVPSALVDAFGRDKALQLALSGGEDYEVVFTGPRQAVERAVSRIELAVVIGEVTADESGRVRVIDAQGGEMTDASPGWEHLGP